MFVRLFYLIYFLFKFILLVMSVCVRQFFCFCCCFYRFFLFLFSFCFFTGHDVKVCASVFFSFFFTGDAGQLVIFIFIFQLFLPLL